MRTGWRLMRLDELGQVSRGKSRHRPRDDRSLYDGPYPFFQTGDIKAANFYLRYAQQTYNEKGFAQSRMWPRGTLCITIAANIAESALLAVDACFPDSIVGFIADPRKSDARFVKYSLDTMKRRMQNISRGTTQDNLSLEKLLSFEISTPPLEIQLRIASILSAYDDLIEVNARRIAILEEMARRLFDEWFVKFRFPDHNQAQLYESEAGLIPKDWKRGTVGALAEYINRGIAPSYDDGDYPAVINQRCIRAGRLNLDLARRQSRSAPDEKLVRRFDVLVNSTGVGTLGRVAQAFAVPPQTSVDTHVTIVRPHEDVDPYFFGVQLITLEDKFTRAGTGSTGQTELSRSAIAEIPVAIPPRMLQRRFGFLVAPMREGTEILAKQNALLRTTRDLLLPKLISGEISLEPELPIQTAAE